MICNDTIVNKFICHTPPPPKKKNQIHFQIGGERFTCRGSKLTNSSGKEQLELYYETHM